VNLHGARHWHLVHLLTGYLRRILKGSMKGPFFVQPDSSRVSRMRWTKFGLTSVGLVLLESVLLCLCLAVNNRQTVPPTQAARNNQTTTNDWRLYNPDANHIWNRLYRSLYRRVGVDGQEYGYDELDPLLWYSTKYLLNQPANELALADLEEFLSTHAERVITDPLQRAIMQRDLWAIFDWTTESQINSPEKLKLQNKLALVIKRLALPPIKYHGCLTRTSRPLQPRPLAPLTIRKNKPSPSYRPICLRQRDHGSCLALGEEVRLQSRTLMRFRVAQCFLSL
jgi:hypothetical protein